MIASNNRLITICEWAGSGLGVIYAILIASNTGSEMVAFVLLFLSGALFAAWAIIDRRWAFLVLQIFYIGSALFGLVRWS